MIGCGGFKCGQACGDARRRRCAHRLLGVSLGLEEEAVVWASFQYFIDSTTLGEEALLFYVPRGKIVADQLDTV